MKKINTIVILAALAFTTFAQSQLKLAKERVGDIEIAYNWKVGEVKEANNVKILRVEGENGIDYRTNIFYIPQSTLLAEVNQKAATEPAYNKDYDELNQYFTNEVQGGQVAIFFDRISKELADPRNFTIVVIDPATNEEVHRTTLEYQAPYSYKWDIWYYYTVVNVPAEVGERFVVRVLDEGLQQTSEFLVYDNLPSTQPPASIVQARK